jgi:hypothetical protein
VRVDGDLDNVHRQRVGEEGEAEVGEPGRAAGAFPASHLEADERVRDGSVGGPGVLQSSERPHAEEGDVGAHEDEHRAVERDEVFGGGLADAAVRFKAEVLVLAVGYQ